MTLTDSVDFDGSRFHGSVGTVSGGVTEQIVDAHREITRDRVERTHQVTDGAAVKTVALGEDGVMAGMRAGSVYVDMGTLEKLLADAG